MIPMDSNFIASLSYMPELFASPKELFTGIYSKICCNFLNRKSNEYCYGVYAGKGNLKWVLKNGRAFAQDHCMAAMKFIIN